MSTTTDSCRDSSSQPIVQDFQEVLTANVGRRVKLVFFLQTRFGPPFGGREITARIVAVGSDYVVIDRICFEGVPILSPLRMTFKTAVLRGVEPLTPQDRLVELICGLSS